MPAAVIIGAGPGLGASIARRFAAEGLPVVLIARGSGPVREIAGQIRRQGGQAMSLRADVTDEAELRAALDRAIEAFGVPEVVVYNAARIRRDKPGELSTAEHAQTYTVNVLGAITAAAHLAPAMAASGGGSFLMTGGMPDPDSRFTSLSLGKAGVRALADMLYQQYGADGMHVASVTIYGEIISGGAFDPDKIAERYWRLHRQPHEQWELEDAYTGVVESGTPLFDLP